MRDGTPRDSSTTTILADAPRGQSTAGSSARDAAAPWNPLDARFPERIVYNVANAANYSRDRCLTGDSTIRGADRPAGFDPPIRTNCLAISRLLWWPIIKINQLPSRRRRRRRIRGS